MSYILVTGCDLIQRSKLIPFHLNESDVSSLYRLLSDIEVGQSDMSLLILAITDYSQFQFLSNLMKLTIIMHHTASDSVSEDESHDIKILT